MDPLKLSFGEKMVGITFNPSNDPRVQSIKAAYATVIDGLNDDKQILVNDLTRLGSAPTGEDNKKAVDLILKVYMFDRAIEHAMTAQMWAVKAVTWK